MKFTKALNLNLLDFDPKWNDTLELMQLVTTKLVKDGGSQLKCDLKFLLTRILNINTCISITGLFVLTPFWTSGKLERFLYDKVGTWETTGAPILFEKQEQEYIDWINLRQNSTDLFKTRDWKAKNACVQVVFINREPVAKLHAEYCDMPNFFLMYRTNKKRNDPPAMNEMGITEIEVGSRPTNPKKSIKNKVRVISAMMKFTGGYDTDNALDAEADIEETQDKDEDVLVRKRQTMNLDSDEKSPEDYSGENSGGDSSSSVSGSEEIKVEEESERSKFSEETTKRISMKEASSSTVASMAKSKEYFDSNGESESIESKPYPDHGNKIKKS